MHNTDSSLAGVDPQLEDRSYHAMVTCHVLVSVGVVLVCYYCDTTVILLEHCTYTTVVNVWRICVPRVLTTG